MLKAAIGGSCEPGCVSCRCLFSVQKVKVQLRTALSVIKVGRGGESRSVDGGGAKRIRDGRVREGGRRGGSVLGRGCRRRRGR